MVSNKDIDFFLKACFQNFYIYQKRENILFKTKHLLSFSNELPQSEAHFFKIQHKKLLEIIFEMNDCNKI
jgi:hypothetical protein